MPLTARMRRELDRMEAANERRLFMNGSEPHGNFRGLSDDEFEDVGTHPFWAELREIHLSDAPNVTRLPPLPRQLQFLRLYETGLREFPDLPPTLSELHLARNSDLQIPNEFPRTLRILSLDHNGLRFIPFLHKGTEFAIREPALEEPFRGILEEYTKRRRAAVRTRPQTANSRREYEQAHRDFIRQAADVWSARKANLRSRGRNVGTLRRLEKAPLSKLPGGVPEEIAAFLTAEPAHNPLEDQSASLRRKHETLPRGARGGASRTRKRFARTTRKA